jgi:hypothetical protein
MYLYGRKVGRTAAGKRYLLALAGAVVLLASLASGPATSAIPTRLLPVRAKLQGLSYRAWDVSWGKLAATTSLRSKRALLTHGANRCGVQIGRARLLPASIGGRITARCRIRAGTYLVFPVTGDAEAGTDRGALRAMLREHFGAIKRAKLRVDGRRLRPGHVITTPFYRVNLPANNLFDRPAGRVWVISRDYFAILSPLPRGRHTIKTLGVIAPPGEKPFSLQMIYRLRVS